jgi:exonuclease VII small subunit
MGNRTLSSLERGELSLGDSPPYYADWEQRLRQIHQRAHPEKDL